MTHIIFSLFSFYIGVFSLLAITGKINLNFKSEEEKSRWFKKFGKLLKVIGTLLIFCGGYQLFIGILEMLK